MLCINQVCHGVSHYVKGGSCSSSSLWSKSQWTVLMGYLTISTNVRRYRTHHKWQFFSFRKIAHRCIVCVIQSNWVKMWFSHFPVLRGTGTTPPQVIWGGVVKASFDCLLYRWHFCQKMSKSILSCPSYSKPNVGQTHDVNRNHKVFLDNFPTLSKLNDFLQFR